MKTAANILMFCAILIGVSVSTQAQTNYKIRQTQTMNGQKTDSTVYVKGARKRSEGGVFMGMGGDVATIEQCDLKRDLKISDKKKLYSIEPFDDADNTETTSTTTKSKIQNSKPKRAAWLPIFQISSTPANANKCSG